jgi:hypothetical protein
MKRLGLLLALLGLVGLVSEASAHDASVHTDLSGFNEVHFVTTTLCLPNGTAPPCVAPSVPVINTAAIRGAVATDATGRFTARLDKNTQVIHYELSYSNLTGAVTQAHIHLGQKHTVGGITVWLCQTAGTPAPAAVAALTPLCPAEGTVEGTITSAQVLAVNGQGLAAGDLEKLGEAGQAGALYVNVHSTVFPPGEIRGQIGDKN